jgi:hypothetical protein
MEYIGYRIEDSLVRIYFDTQDAAGGAASFSDTLELADFRIYKDGGATEKVTTNGLTFSEDFDTLTGLHVLEIDTSNDTGDVGFWVSGSEYAVMLAPDTETLAGQTIRKWIGSFRLTPGDTASVYTDSQVLRSVLSTGIVAETNNKTLIEQIKAVIAVGEHRFARFTYQPQGKIFFVDPVNGATHASGARGGITDPYAGVQDCHDNAVVDSRHDLIILVAGASGGPTTLTEAVTLTKRYLSIRGPGRDFIWTRAGSGDTITVGATADGNEFSGFQLNTAVTGSGNGLEVTGVDRFRAYRLWVNDTRGHGISISNCNNFVVRECQLQNTGQSGSGHGVAIGATVGNTSNYGRILDNVFHDVSGDSIRLTPTGSGVINATDIGGNLIEGSAANGINVNGANCTATFIHDNRFGVNVTADITDTGTGTILLNNEQWARNSSLPANLSVLGISVGGVATGNTVQINSNTLSAVRLALSAEEIIPGTVDDAAFPPSTTQFEVVDITEATADHFNGRIIIWTSGALKSQATDIIDYSLVGGRGRFEVSLLTEAPADADTFVIL